MFVVVFVIFTCQSSVLVLVKLWLFNYLARVILFWIYLVVLAPLIYYPIIIEAHVAFSHVIAPHVRHYLLHFYHGSLLSFKYEILHNTLPTIKILSRNYPNLLPPNLNCLYCN